MISIFKHSKTSSNIAKRPKITVTTIVLFLNHNHSNRRQYKLFFQSLPCRNFISNIPKHPKAPSNTVKRPKISITTIVSFLNHDHSNRWQYKLLFHQLHCANFISNILKHSEMPSNTVKRLKILISFVSSYSVSLSLSEKSQQTFQSHPSLTQTGKTRMNLAPSVP